MASASGVLVLAIEDLQWADDGLLDLVEHIVEWGGDSPLTLLCTARPEFLERRRDWPGVRRVQALSPEATVELLGELLTGTPVPGEVWSRLLTATGGNPLYAEEYARMLVEGAPEGELPLPESVHALIAARLDVLGRDAKAVLQDAAVVGKEFWVSPLEQLAGLSRETVEERLVELERKGFVSARAHSAVAGETQYAFSHVLIRDIAYGQIPRSRRTEKHRLAGDWVAALAPDRASNLAEMTAHHYASALEYARLSGQPSDELSRHARERFRPPGTTHRSSTRSPRRSGSTPCAPARSRGDAERPRFASTSAPRASGPKEEGLTTSSSARVPARRGRRRAGRRGRRAAGRAAVPSGRRRRGIGRLEAAATCPPRDAPPSRPKALVLSSLSRFSRRRVRSCGGDPARGGGAGDGRAACGGRDPRARAEQHRPGARHAAGDAGGVADLERRSRLGGPRLGGKHPRLSDLGTTLAHLGDLERAYAVRADGRRAAKRLGDATGIRWFAVERLFEGSGRAGGDEASVSAEALLAAVEVPADCYTELGRGRSAAGSASAAATSKAPSRMPPVRGARPQVPSAGALSGARAGGEDEAPQATRTRHPSSPANCRVRGHGTVETAAFWTADLASLVELGAGARSSSRPARRGADPWLEAACAFASGDAAAAADRYGVIGSRPDEAFARLRAGDRNGDDFVRRVGAAGYLATA